MVVSRYLGVGESRKFLDIWIKMKKDPLHEYMLITNPEYQMWILTELSNLLLGSALTWFQLRLHICNHYIIGFVAGPRYCTVLRVRWSRTPFWKALLSDLKTKSLVFKKESPRRKVCNPFEVQRMRETLYTTFCLASIVTLYVVLANFVKNIRSNSQDFSSYQPMVQMFSLGFLAFARRFKTLLLLACLWALAWAGVDFKLP